MNEHAAKEVDAAAALASIVVGILADYYESANVERPLPADAAQLLGEIGKLPDWRDDAESWAVALAELHSPYALPTPEALGSRSPELAYALRVLSETRSACGGYWRLEDGTVLRSAREIGRPNASELRHLVVAAMWAGIAIQAVSSPKPAELEKAMRSALARRGAAEKLQRDPKQAAKRAIREGWDAWQQGRARHKSQAAFARAMCADHPAIESPNTVERWAREWAAERKELRLASKQDPR